MAAQGSQPLEDRHVGKLGIRHAARCPPPWNQTRAVPDMATCQSISGVVHDDKPAPKPQNLVEVGINLNPIHGRPRMTELEDNDVSYGPDHAHVLAVCL